MRKKCKNAFTLAEVLIVLAVIGVVAALTVPAVITKVSKDQYVVGLKKAYNTLKSVEREAIQEHGPMENWSWSTGGYGSDPAADFEKYFLPHLDVLKKCEAGDKGCFSSKNSFIDGRTWDYSFNSSMYYRIITSDGMCWVYGKDNMANNPGYFYVDINCLKGPNVLGRDIFAFEVFSSHLGIKPAGMYSNSTSINTVLSSAFIEASCKTSGTSSGRYCATKILSEGGMNY